ncbi:MAG: chemotaxis protein CheX [Acidobacteria bacterium]|nr:chemotaxis protein CheX [Acidobacteriota bacterium]
MVFPVESYQSEINQIVEVVFSTMLATDVRPDEAEMTVCYHPSVTAAIFFAGSWKGAVLVECSVLQACHWTAKLVSIPIPDSITDDVRDAMGELVNMIGGNLKSVLPVGVGLSMPTVVQGGDYVMKLCGGNLVNRRVFHSPLGKFSVTLIEVVEK